MSVLIGCNSRIFDSMREAGISVRTFRAYRDKYNFVPAANSPRPKFRADWFALLAEWMSDNGGRCLETFWNPTGSLSGPWLPEDRKTIGALRSISAA